ncbi:exported hypothetical protein [Vibrio nigripulchritudo SO65]|uniref:hypothetical protein n=1 Tax=Vibrio nigripulchritudo TaxID=28173 RepID=UPI0003B23AD4|nr:hypothetical protein [Vibrio nigripulchritudo]CCN38734.1 exported hypothetical protein [Vibrio nigripulchritudo AM115]CCN45041.1 exported hypothetical protein [Vibrio nigripulchritudo FTn2]CCN79800.1 exported hypothetical protein [Vibrio nigripulchritudo SO65]
MRLLLLLLVASISAGRCHATLEADTACIQGREIKVCFDASSTWSRGTISNRSGQVTTYTEKVWVTNKLGKKINIGVAVPPAPGLKTIGSNDTLGVQFYRGSLGHIDIPVSHVGTGTIEVSIVDKNNNVQAITVFKDRKAKPKKTSSCTLTPKQSKGKLTFMGDGLPARTDDIGIVEYKATPSMFLSFEAKAVRRSSLTVFGKRKVDIYYKETLAGRFKKFSAGAPVRVSGEGVIYLFPQVRKPVSQLKAGKYRTRIEVTCRA